MDLLKTLFGASQHGSRADTTPNSPDPDPNDVWAFTDPDARDEYDRQGRLRQLEHDIRFEIMRGGPWQSEELEYKREIRRLLSKEVIADKGTYWYRSPHPTVYRARRDGRLTVAGKAYSFSTGDDIAFQCRMERDEADDDPGPVLIAHLQSTDKAVLCGDMSSSMRGSGKRMGKME